MPELPSTHVDLTKLIVALAAIAGSVVLGALHIIDGAAVTGSITGVVGYILGNGRAVAQGDRPGTMLTNTSVRTRAVDRDDDA